MPDDPDEPFLPDPDVPEQPIPDDEPEQGPDLTGRATAIGAARFGVLA